jgi:hypothetical protein
VLPAADGPQPPTAADDTGFGINKMISAAAGNKVAPVGSGNLPTNQPSPESAAVVADEEGFGINKMISAAAGNKVAPVGSGNLPAGAGEPDEAALAAESQAETASQPGPDGEDSVQLSDQDEEETQALSAQQAAANISDGEENENPGEEGESGAMATGPLDPAEPGGGAAAGEDDEDGNQLSEDEEAGEPQLPVTPGSGQEEDDDGLGLGEDPEALGSAPGQAEEEQQEETEEDPGLPPGTGDEPENAAPGDDVAGAEDGDDPADAGQSEQDELSDGEAAADTQQPSAAVEDPTTEEQEDAAETDAAQTQALNEEETEPTQEPTDGNVPKAEDVTEGSVDTTEESGDAGVPKQPDAPDKTDPAGPADPAAATAADPAAATAADPAAAATEDQSAATAADLSSAASATTPAAESDAAPGDVATPEPAAAEPAADASGAPAADDPGKTDQQEQQVHDERVAMGVGAGALGAAQAATIASNLTLPGLGGGSDSGGAGGGVPTTEATADTATPQSGAAAIEPGQPVPASDLGLTGESSYKDYANAIKDVPPDEAGISKIKIDSVDDLVNFGIPRDVANRLWENSLLNNTWAQAKVGSPNGLDLRENGGIPKPNEIKDKSLDADGVAAFYPNDPDAGNAALGQVHTFTREEAVAAGKVWQAANPNLDADGNQIVDPETGQPVQKALPDKIDEAIKQGPRNEEHLTSLMNPEVGGERLGDYGQTVRFVVSKNDNGAMFGQDVLTDGPGGAELRNPDGSFQLGPSRPIVEDLDFYAQGVMPGGNTNILADSEMHVQTDPNATSYLQKTNIGVSFGGTYNDPSFAGQGDTPAWDPTRDANYENNMAVKQAVINGVARKGYLECTPDGWSFCMPSQGNLPVPPGTTEPWKRNEFFDMKIPDDPKGFMTDQLADLSFRPGTKP